jgi:hypothetical protein
LQDRALAPIVVLAQRHPEEPMRKRRQPDDQLDRMHWEGLIRTIIRQIGADRLAEIIDYLVDEMRDEERRLHHFAVETRREH